MDTYNWNEQNNQNMQNGQQYNQNAQYNQYMQYQTGYVDSCEKKNNYGLGILGAFIGSFIGGAVIVLIGELGYVAVVGGVVMALCTVKGYDMMCGGVDKKGIITCIAMMIFMTFGAEYFQWAFEIYKEFKADGYTFLEVLLSTWDVITYSDLTSDFLGSLALNYLFTAIGAFGIIKKLMPEK